ncbi:MAG TPA: LpqB family beta-propeller domain-containing protein [Bryobacteraceae bacterium]|nr:LpqB family beta-propeller domain-containing protein [Bryobacteraceae bacterium]
MSLNPGARLGAYEVVSRLGAGAMGEVFRARDMRLGREVALKILPAEFAIDPDRRRRFEQESRAASALSHPNIVTVYDVGDQDGVSYIVSELVDGESLRDLIERGPVPLRRAIEIGAQIADGLAAAHAANVVHRDLKPENIMLTRDGRPKILDFGLARYQPAAAAESGMTMTMPGMVMGTAGYMSPEQVTGSATDARSDIFSLGIILHEMLSGKIPFARATAIETMSAILRDDPPELPATLPPAVQQVIVHCLEKEPARRFQSAGDLAFNLRAISPGSTAGAQIAVRSHRTRRPLSAAAITAIALGITTVVLAAILATRPPQGAELANYRFTPLATDARPQHDPAWSPDGQNIAYIRDVDNAPDQILVRGLSSPVPAVVTAVNRPRSLFWSPDSSRIYFVADGGVFSVSRGGGAAQQVLKGNYYCATLSPDGKAIALWLTVGDAEKSEPKVWISSPPGTPPRKYEPVPFELQGSFTPIYMRFSPDGKQILVSMTRGAGPRLWLLPFPSGKPRRILTNSLSGGEIPNLNWMPDSRHFVMAFTRSGDSAQQLWMADSRHETFEPLTAGEGERGSPAVSPDGAKIAFNSFDSNLDIVEIPTAGGPVQPLLATSRSELFPFWSPKGSVFAYVTDRTGRREIWLKNATDGSDRPLVTARDFPDSETVDFLTPAISPDGTRIAYSRVSNQHVGELWISPLSGGSPLRIGNPKAYEIAPSWSPDGNWLAYFSSDLGVAKIAVGGSDSPVSLGLPHGCENAPQWSPDGAWIACGTDKGVVLVSPDGKQRRTVGNRKAYITWSRDGKEIYALGQVEGGKWRFGAIDFRGGAERAIYDYDAEIHFASAYNPSFPMSLSPDGKNIATTVAKIRSDIWLLEGFPPK